MYVAQTISSILNGFGQTKQTLYHNLIGMAVRILFILTAIPAAGIKGYLYGLLSGYAIQISLDLLCIFKISLFPFSVEKTLFLPSALALSGGLCSQQLYHLLSGQTSLPPFFLLAVCGIFYGVFFTFFQLFLEHITNP